MKAIDVVIAVAKALRDWDGSPEQAAEKLGAAVEAVKSFAPAQPAPKIECPFCHGRSSTCEDCCGSGFIKPEEDKP